MPEPPLPLTVRPNKEPIHMSPQSSIHLTSTYLPFNDNMDAVQVILSLRFPQQDSLAGGALCAVNDKIKPSPINQGNFDLGSPFLRSAGSRRIFDLSSIFLILGTSILLSVSINNLLLIVFLLYSKDLYKHLSIIIRQKKSRMGNLTTLSVDQNDENASLKINMSFKEPIINELKQLTNWSLEEIRQIYVPFRKRKGSPIMSRSEFLRFIRLSRITSFYIYDKIRQTSPINIFEIISMLTLTSYAQVNHKVQFFFNLFDLEGNKVLQFKQLVLMFTSIIRAYGILTGQPLPDHNNLQKYAQTMFSRADLNNDQNLQLGEVLGWFQSHTQGVNLLNSFEPKCLGKQSYHVFNGFPPYSEVQIQILFQRLNKIYHNQQITEDDYKILIPARKSSKLAKLQKQNIFHDSMNFSQFLKIPNRMFETSMLAETYKSNTTQMGKSNSLYKFSSHGDQLKMPKLPHNKLQDSKLSQSIHQKPTFKKKAFNNIIIIKGRTITKKQLFDLRDYFDKISNGKKAIIIEDFLESFNQEKYNHMKSVAASLYNFLDKKQNGRVTFLQLVLKLYPDLTKQHIKIVQNWSEQYSSNFNLDKKIKANRQLEEHKKRVLPKTCVPRFREIYKLFDKDKKGYVLFEDLKRVLGDVSTQKQLMEAFEDSDLDKDGKLSFQEFSHILLPPDLQIQGLQ